MWLWGWEGAVGYPRVTLRRASAPPTPGPTAGHGKASPSTGGQQQQEMEEEEEEVEDEEAAGDEEEDEVTLVTRHKRHPEPSEGQAIASVIIYRTLAGLLPEQYDTDKRSLRCHGGLWGTGGGHRAGGVGKHRGKGCP